jgi:multiple sugar transport system permease protein
MMNWPYVYAAARTDADASPVTKKVFENLGWARWPGVNKGEPSRVSIGGANIGVSKYGRDPKLAAEAAICMTSRKWQDQEAINEGLPPVTNGSYDDPKVREAYPFADLLREQLKDAVPRPETPAYSDVTLAVQQTLHPPRSINPEAAINKLRDRLKTLMASVSAPTADAVAAKKKPGITDRARAERNLAWKLCAPAVIVMGLVAGFPIGYAFWLSLQKADLRFPDATEFVGLQNYISVLSSSTWWTDVLNTLFITVCSVTLELIIGMLIAQAMYRAIFARTAIRASVLVPYGAVTVVAAFAWRLAFDPATGFVTQLFGIDTPPFTTRGGSFFVIIMAEVWKTTPFIALLLLGGLALVPEDLYKAAKMDGASAWQRFTKITLPLIRPALAVAVLFRTLDAFRIYDVVFIMTRGANNTETVSVLGYQQLINRLNLGLGSAVSILIFFCVILIAVAFTRFLGASPARR